MKDYIDFNTKQRSIAKTDIEKDLFKLANNAVFGITMENVRKRIRFEIVNDQTRLRKVFNDPTYSSSVIYNENLVGVLRHNSLVTLDKPICVGFAILELSKLLMYDFHYNVIK